MAIITLTTDFGWADYYVGAMKGVICQIAPKATIVDITHDIDPHDILAGALVLREICRTFPPKTIHLAVVDPGVGTERKIILVQLANQMILAPDNGLITLIQQISPANQANIVSNDSLFCQPVSPTFHGRDIFAPVAAHLAKGIRPGQVGPTTDYLTLLDIPVCQYRDEGKLVGQVIHVDRYGNLVTNIDADALRHFARPGTARNLMVHLDQHPVGTVSRTFAEAQGGQAVTYIGSAGLLEIAVNRGRADIHFNAKPGTAVVVT